LNLFFSRRSLVITFVFLLLVIILFTVFVDMETVIQQVRHADWRYLVAASLFLLTGFVAYAIRWRILMANKPGFSPTFNTSNAGNMVNTLLPLRPGDAVRIVMLGQSSNIPYMEVTSSIVVERWFEQIMRLAAFGGAIVFGAGLEVSYFTVFGSLVFLAMSMAVMVLMVRKKDFVLRTLPPILSRLPRLSEEKSRHELNNLLDGLIGVASAHRLTLVLIWSAITWALFWAFHFLCLQSLGIPLDIQDQLAMSLGSLALVPPSATTLPGVYQVSMVVPLSLVGYDQNILTSYALLMNIIEIAWVVLLGVWGTARAGLTIRGLVKKGISQDLAAEPTED
jgi:uncharacterized protein (TIRG00374 family)